MLIRVETFFEQAILKGRAGDTSLKGQSQGEKKNKKAPGVTQYALYFKRIPSNKGFLDLNPITYEVAFPFLSFMQRSKN